MADSELILHEESSVRELTQAEREVLRKLTVHPLLFASFIGFVGVRAAFDEELLEAEGPTTFGVDDLYRAAVHGAHYMDGFKEQIFAESWPENTTPACDYYDYMLDWLNYNVDSHASVKLETGETSQTVREFLGLGAE